MGRQTYTARVIVLRKTKLGESDLILTLLSSDGSQMRAVAKGARKPQSPFASRLELLSEADVLMARGRTLDIVKEARLVAGNAPVRLSMERAAAAAPIAELLDRITQENLANPKLFASTHAALCALDTCDAAHAPAVCAAQLLKVFAFAGIRPSLSECCLCGEPLSCDVAGPVHADIAFSYVEGGVVCDGCRTPDSVGIPVEVVSWARALLGMRFADIAAGQVDLSAVFGVLRMCQGWAHMHASVNLKSLNFLFSCGLF